MSKGRKPPRITERDRIVIENVSPALDGGRWPVKREVGDSLRVEADLLRDGHDLLAAALRYRVKGESWLETPLEPVENDRWAASFRLDRIGRYGYTVHAWTDRFGSWRRDMARRLEAGGAALDSLRGDLLEGEALVKAAARRAEGEARASLRSWLEQIKALEPESGARLALDGELAELVAAHPDRSAASRLEREFEVVVDPVRARFAAWYELFPRSYGEDGQHGTFADVARELPRIAAMGFDVLYLPPIHPIGRVNRKGRNNSLVALEGDPGSPWAIGSSEGGHTAIHPELGTLEDFRELVRQAAGLGLEVALDFAVQAAPDHPWAGEHPGYFFQRADGTIKYAENPPKRYEDIYPINFYGDEAEALWLELEEVLEFWIDQGVSTFRVDNPHTKSLAFWPWVIERVKGRHPEALFLAEAFTRPKVMKHLAKSGFSQSYTYFTWRNTKSELEAYLTELTRSEMREYFRGNFFANTPDILHEYLVQGGLPAFKVRLVLAATLSSLYGIYSGYEVGDNEPFPGKEEHNNNEKYQLRRYDFSAPGNLVSYITRVNAIRRENRALHEFDNLTFCETSSDQLIAYAKTLGENRVLCVVNLDPHQALEGLVRVALGQLGLPHNAPYVARDLLTGSAYGWRGEHNFVRLDPAVEPAHVFRLEPEPG